MKKLVFLVLIFFTSNLICMQEQKIKVTIEEVLNFKEKSDIFCVLCWGDCDEIMKYAEEELIKKLQQRNLNNKKA